MKRQRSVPGSGAAAATKKKSARKMAEKVKEEEVAVEEKRRDGEERDVDVEDAEIRWDDWPLPCSWSPVVDEQLPWGMFWCPFWDQNFVEETHIFNAFYGDVWEDDIWELKGIQEIPKS